MPQSPVTRHAFGFLRKLRVLDYLIIIAILLGSILLFKYFHPQQKWTEITVRAYNISLSQMDALRVGDIEKDPSGKKTAEIIEMQLYDENWNGNVFMKVNILTNVNPQSGGLEYKNKIIKVGSPIEFLFNSTKINGNINKLEGVEEAFQTETKILTLILYNRNPWLAESFTVGGGETDQTGKKMVEILTKEVRPAEIIAKTISGQVVAATDPRKVDIILTVRVQALKIGDRLIFRQNQPMRIGETVSFNVGETARVRDASITKIE